MTSDPASPRLIRPWRPKDIDQIRHITLQVFGPSTFERNIEQRYGMIGGHDWQWRKTRHLDHDLALDNGQCLVAVVDSLVVGYVTVSLDAESRIGIIPNLAVLKEYSNQGIGRALLDAAVEIMREGGMELARIETLQQNEVGQHLYPQVGFEEIARQIYFAMDLRPDS